MRQETGDRRSEAGDGRQEKLDRRLETGDRGQETGTLSKTVMGEPGGKTQEFRDRRRLTVDVRQET